MGELPAPNSGPRAGRRFQPFFTAVCIYVREKSKRPQSHIATLAGVGEPSIKRFEKGETFPTENFDQYLAAYADVAHMDPRDLLVLAADWWKEHGLPPITTERIDEVDLEAEHEPTANDVLAAIRLAETVEPQPDEAAQPPTATRTRQAAAE